MTTEIAYFISSHGYGHATRAIAVLDALHAAVPDIEAHLFTTVPRSLFEAVPWSFTYHFLQHDIGIVQPDAFRLDLTATVECLGSLIPFDKESLADCARTCRSCVMIVCDISAFGILVGRQAGIASVLVENFTWDWIYYHLAGREPRLLAFADLLAEYYRGATYRIQTTPVCSPAPCQLTCPPIARRPALRRETIRNALGVGEEPVVLISTGGMPLELAFVEMLAEYPGYRFLLAGHTRFEGASGNVTALPPGRGWYHPDLINAADLLIAKCGYSTIAECCQTDTPICTVGRRDFAESEVLETFVVEEMGGRVIDAGMFLSGAWLADLPALLGRRRRRVRPGGAEQCAAFLASHIC